MVFVNIKHPSLRPMGFIFGCFLKSQTCVARACLICAGIMQQLKANQVESNVLPK